MEKNGTITVYAASAGSGKTYALAYEYIKLIVNNPHGFMKILAVTFTNKASGEMKQRIIDALYTLAHHTPESNYTKKLEVELNLDSHAIQERAKQALTIILHNYSFFYVETIDSFFQRIIRNFTKELGLDSQYGIQLQLDEVLQKSVEQMLLTIHENPKAQQWLIEYSFKKIEEGKSRNVANDIIKNSAILFKENFMRLQTETLTFADIEPFYTHVESVKFNFEKKVKEIAEKIIDIFKLMQLSKKMFLRGSFMNPLYAIAEQNIYNNTKFLYDEKFLTPEAWFAKTSEHQHRVDEIVQHGAVRFMRELMQLYTDNYKQYITADMLFSSKYNVGMLQSVQQAIETYCKEQRLFLISNTNYVLQGITQESDTPFVYEKIGNYLKYIMIDEFQDTSYMQWQNFLPLVENSLAEGGNVLFVGDVKQAIYRFRGGEWQMLHTGIDEKFPRRVTKISLQDNWRSKQNIIHFNNAFFKQFVQTLEQSVQGRLIKDSQGDEAIEKMVKNLQGMIANLYDGHEQLIAPERKNFEGGYVLYRELKSAKEVEEVIECIELQTVFNDVLQLFQQGYNPEDIVFLCRKSSEVNDLVAYFSEKKHDYPLIANKLTIVSREGMYLYKSDSIQFIISYLQYLENPHIAFYADSLRYMVQHKLYPHTYEEFMPLLDTKITIESLSLVQITEAILAQFKLNTLMQELVYIVEFQNIVYEFSKRGVASISHFIEWWEENKIRKKISQEPKGFMRAMTIHSSKGLQFPVVIIPFANWQYENHQSTILSSTQGTDFNSLKFANLPYSKAVLMSQFSSKYADERYQSYIDNCNLFYVACTRAEEVLYLQVPPKRGNAAAISDDIKITMELLGSALALKQETLQIKEWESGSLVARTVKNNEKMNMNTQYPVYIKQLPLMPVPESYNYAARIYSAEQQHGIRMHRLFELITQANDIEYAVQTIVRENLIQQHETNAYIQYSHAAIANAGVERWFSKSATVWAERTIMTPEGEKRPDRIVLTHKKNVEVIDYKFTQKEERKHITQVQEYKNILNSMGYSTKAYIWYVLQDKTVEV